MRLNEERLLKVVMLEALGKWCKIKWVQNLKTYLEMVGWDGVSVEDLRFVNGGSEESLDGCSVERGKG